MITKLQTISFLKTALAYCERGGELLDSHKCLGTSETIHLQMHANNILNDRCSKKSFHIKIRIAPEDKGILNTQDWIDISKDYAKTIGFENNPYAVYIHEENTEKEHIHIVASRIKENNTAVSNSYTHYKNLDFSRVVEKKYNLRIVPRKLEKLKKQELFYSQDKRLPALKEKITAALASSNNMVAMIAYLKRYGIGVKIGRGITFTDINGVTFKGSQISRKFTLKGLAKAMTPIKNTQTVEAPKKEKQKQQQNQIGM